MFNLTMGLNDDEIKGRKINIREAARGVIIRDNKLLMIHNNKGDYKLPGGGVKKNEGKEHALIREVREESGNEVKTVDRLIGHIIERNMDTYEDNAVFEMVSSYYICSLSEVRKNQHLDDYEKEMEFIPVWINIEDAICHNEKLLEGNTHNNRWLTREIMALKEIRKMI